VTGRGAVIRPTSEAVSSPYDPWDEHNERPRGSNESPYGSLIDLLDDPELERARGATVPDLSIGARTKLLDWCQRYGLLGLCTHENRQVTLPARFEVAASSDVPGKAVLVPTLRQWEWVGGAWTEHVEQDGGSALLPADSVAAGGQPLVGTRDYPERWPQAGVEHRPLMGSALFEWRHADLREWRQYFPERRPDAPLLGPWDETFWHEYAEPVGDFLNAIHNLTDVIRAVVRHRDAPDHVQVPRIAAFFNRFLDRVQPVIRPGDDQPWEIRWAAPSLLAQLVMMARDDLAVGIVRLCASSDCQRIFRSSARAVTYCSDRCRSREQKRKQAGKRRQAGNSAGGGTRRPNV
jgi:hypothetical protein